MLVNKVLISQDKDNIEINRALNHQETKQLEKLAKRFVYRFGLIGWRNIDINGNNIFNYLWSDARIKYTPNNSIVKNPLDFSFSYGESSKVPKFLKRFQKKFGKIEDSKIIYE